MIRTTLRSTRLVALQFALVAMVLRALMPVGWMPNPSADNGGAPFVFCTMQGAVTVTIGPDGRPVKQSPAKGQGHNHDVCPFAAAAHLAPPALLAAVPLKTEIATGPRFDRLSELPRLIGRFNLHPARAPPYLA